MFADGGYLILRRIVMLELKNINITLEPSGRKIIANLNYTLQRGVKCAVIGEEGDGKSTLLKYIYDKNLISGYCAANGSVIKHGAVAYLPQFLEEKFENVSVAEYLADTDIYDSFDLADKLKIPTEFLFGDRTMSSLSGGERVKIRLFKLLCAKPGILLLDEPTNDLDAETLEWLEDFLKRTLLSVLFVSHDRMLLSKVAENIIHVEQLIKKTDCKITVATCGYSEYVEKRADLIGRQTQIAEKQRDEFAKKLQRWQRIHDRVEYELNTVSRQNPSGGRLLKKKMAGVQAQKKRFERERETFLDIPDTECAIVTRFYPDVSLPAGKTVLNLNLAELKVGEKLLAKDIFLNVGGNEKVVITGANGAGKSTLLGVICNALKDRTDIKSAYMPQDYASALDFSLSPIDFLECADKEETTRARMFLGNMRFTSNEMTGKIAALSGGQQAKLLFLKMLLKRNNVLLLDEPTRNFSPLSAPAVCDALKDFGGCIIAVSHDRAFIEEVCTAEYYLTPDGLKKLK